MRWSRPIPAWASTQPPAGYPPPFDAGAQQPMWPGEPKRQRSALIPVLTAAAVVIVAIAGVVGYLVLGRTPSRPVGPKANNLAIRVASSKLITQTGTSEPKAVLALYEDFLCPACRRFEQTYGPTVSQLIDSGAVAADYYPVAILDRPENQDYSSRAGAAAYCVADVSIDAFRRFHAALFTNAVQPSETSSSFPDNARLIELAREAGAQDPVANCINSGKYVARVTGMASQQHVSATPTVRINGEDYRPLHTGGIGHQDPRNRRQCA